MVDLEYPVPSARAPGASNVPLGQGPIRHAPAEEKGERAAADREQQPKRKALAPARRVAQRAQHQLIARDELGMGWLIAVVRDGQLGVAWRVVNARIE